MYIGALTPASAAIFRKNVYEAVRIAIGTSGTPGTPDNIKVSRIAEEYATPRVKTLATSMSRDQVLKDPAFQAIVARYQGMPAPSGGEGWGLNDSMVGGVPNYVLYAGFAVVAGLIVRKLMKGRKKGRK